MSRFVSLGIALLVASCSGDEEADEPAGVEPSMMVARIAAAQCDRILACCDDAQRELFFGGADVPDAASCEAALVARSEAFWLPALDRARTDKTIVISESGLQSCAASLEAESCDAFEPLPDAEVLTHTGCRDVVTAGLTLSAFCTDDFECDTGFCSHPPGDAVGACKNPPGLDEPCLHDRCADELRCTPDGVCAERLSEGDECASNGDCRSRFCDAALDVAVCAETTAVCEG